jgi:hypothetical protein
MLMTYENLYKESIMTKEDKKLFVNILPEQFKNNVDFYLGMGVSHDAVLTVLLSGITEQSI